MQNLTLIRKLLYSRDKRARSVRSYPGQTSLLPRIDIVSTFHAGDYAQLVHLQAHFSTHAHGSTR